MKNLGYGEPDFFQISKEDNYSKIKITFCKTVQDLFITQCSAIPHFSNLTVSQDFTVPWNIILGG